MMLHNLLHTLRFIGKQHRQQQEKLVQREPDRQQHLADVNRLQREYDIFFRLWQRAEACSEREFCILRLYTKERARQALLDAWQFQQDSNVKHLIFAKW